MRYKFSVKALSLLFGVLICSCPVTAELKSIPGFLMFPRMPATNAPIYGTMLLDAADEKVACIVQAPKTGNIRKVGFRTGTVTTGATLDIRLETVSATDGDPTGTLLATDTNVSHVLGDGDDSIWITTAALTADAAITIGDIFSIVIVNPSGSPGTFLITKGGDPTFAQLIFPYADLFTSSWTKQAFSQTPVCAVEYDDGTYANMGTVVYSATALLSWNSGSTPDEVGIKFKLPFTTRIKGINAIFELDQDTTVKFYDNADSLLTFIDLDKDQRGADPIRQHDIIFPAPQTILKDTFYRITFLPSTTTPDIRASELTFASAAIMDAWGSQNFHKTERTDAGAWTDTTTKSMSITLFFDQFDDGVSAGGGAIPATVSY